MKIFKTFFNGIPQFVLSLLLIGSVGLALASQNFEDEVSVPKGIQDIVISLKQASVEKKSREDDLKLISKEVSKTAKAEVQYSEYYFQAMAAERLGRINLRIDLLNKSLQYAEPGTQQEFRVTTELVQAEMLVGDSKKAISRFEKVLDKVPSRYSGQ
ncbi:MAG: hypothetical protein NTX83_01775, partial [Burkholderiales bacterium]|nr:hypothetical protein [Burkholderiales bacterium]